MSEMVERVEEFNASQPNRRGATPQVSQPMGCICPPGAEKGCRGPMCPRQPIDMRARS